MKKVFLMGSVAVMSFVLCGYGSAETLDSLSEKIAAASADTRSVSATIACNLKASLKASDSTSISGMPITASASVRADYTMEPVALRTDGTANVAILTAGQPVPLDIYAVTDENGVMTAFMKDSANGNWELRSADDIDIMALMRSVSDVSGALDRMSEWGLDFELAPETVDADDGECYLLCCTVGPASLNEIIRRADEKTGYELSANKIVRQALPLLDGIRIKLECYVSTSSCLPVRVHADLNDSDLNKIEHFIGGTFDLDDCSLDMTLDYDTVDEIVVPDEVLEEVIAGTAAAPTA